MYLHFYIKCKKRCPPVWPKEHHLANFNILPYPLIANFILSWNLPKFMGLISDVLWGGDLWPKCYEGEIVRNIKIPSPMALSSLRVWWSLASFFLLLISEQDLLDTLIFNLSIIMFWFGWGCCLCLKEGVNQLRSGSTYLSTLKTSGFPLRLRRSAGWAGSAVLSV